MKKIHKYSMFDIYKYLYLLNGDWCVVYLWPLASQYDKERGFWRSHEPVAHCSVQHPTDAGQKTQNSLLHTDYPGTPLSLLPEISIKIIILILQDVQKQTKSNTVCACFKFMSVCNRLFCLYMYLSFFLFNFQVHVCLFTYSLKNERHVW